MDKTSQPSRKRVRKPQRFQVDPLAVFSISDSDSAPINENIHHYSPEAEPDIPANQKIEIISVDLVLPDPWNPRHVLPEIIRKDFVAGELDAETAVRVWIKLGETDLIIAEQIQQFRFMGTSLHEQGQINPINVAKHFRKDGSFIWRIESGERRYWAKWLLIVDGIATDSNIHAILRDALDPTRQAVENLQNESLTAVGEARQIARLFLDQLEITPESEIAHGILSGSDDYFRIALRPASELLKNRQRLPRGFWQKLENIVGNKRRHLERKVQILGLPTELLSLADQQQLTERQLREILSSPQNKWEMLIKITVEHDLSGPELEWIVSAQDPDSALELVLKRRNQNLAVESKTTESSPNTPPPLPEKQVKKRILSLAKFFDRSNLITNQSWDLDQVADEIIQSGNHQLVIDSLTQVNALLDRLKARVQK